MVWYDPRTWFKPTPKEEKKVVAPETTAVRSIDVVKVEPTTGKPTGGVAVTVTGKEAWSGGGGISSVAYGGAITSAEAQRVASQVALDTGTGYNVATGVQEGLPATKLPTQQSVMSAYTKEEVTPLTTQLTFQERIKQAQTQFNLMNIGGAIGSIFSYRKWGQPKMEGFTIPQRVTTGGEFKFEPQYEYEWGRAITGGLPAEAYGIKLGEDISKQLQAKYQEKVSSGEYQITSEGYLTGKGLEDYNREFSKFAEQQSIVSGRAYGVIEQYKPRFKEYGEAIGAGVTTAGLIGATFVSPPLATLGFATTTGLSATQFERGILGKQLQPKERAFAIGGGLVGMGLGVAGFKYGVVEPLRSQITMAEIRGALETPPRIYIGEVEMLEAGKIKQTYYGLGKYGGAERLTKYDLISQPLKDIIPSAEKLYISTGKATHFLEAYEFATAKPILVGAESKIYGLGYTYPVPTKDIYSSIVYGKAFPKWEFITKFKTIEVSDFYKAKIKLYETAPPKESLIAGLSQQQQKDIFQVSGKISDILMTPKFTGVAFKPEDFLKLKLKEAPQEFIKGGLSAEQFSTRITGELIGRPSFVSKELLAPQFTLSELVSPKAVPSFIITSAEKQRLTSIQSAMEMQKFLPSVAPSLISANIEDVTTRLSSGVIQTQFQPQLQKQLQVTGMAFVQPPITTQPTIPAIPTTFFVPPILPWLPKFEFDESLSKRMFAGKQRYKYIPSYEAFVFKIKGKAPKGLETGARLRPIPKGFSLAYKGSPIKFGRFGGGFKMPKTSFKLPKFNFKFKSPKIKFKGFGRRIKRRKRKR